MTVRITRSREYLIALGNYENVKVGASVETSVPDTYDPEEEANELDSLLDILLATEIERAQEITVDKDSFVLSDEFKQQQKG